LGELMEIWSIIRDEHHRLEALVRQAEAEPHDELIAAAREELIAHIRAEEEALDRALLSHSGFESAVAAVHEENRKLLALCEELAGAAPARCPSILDAIEVALSGHIEAQTKILPVAEHTLTRHASEHLKHAFETAKHAHLEGVSVVETTSASPGSVPLNPSSAKTGTEFMKVLDRIHRQESESLFVCETAIDLLKHPEYRSLLGEIAEEHLHKVREIELLTGDRPNGSAGKVAGWTKLYAAAVFGDKATLKTVRSAEEKARVSYERMLHNGRSEGHVRALLEPLVASVQCHVDQIDSGRESTEMAKEIAE
jgi:hypothetical protein